MNFRIQTIWAFVSVDPEDGDEGVIGMRLGGQWLPFVAADERRIAELRPHAQELVDATGRLVTIARFDVRTDVERISPKEGKS